ncbi:hypothetical protein [Luteolibacter sp. LG18]|uniref:hypothetical protein n=1 Tax=Luteolibacter sp. LG18 TaxID=2819286 RepID=UPI002B31B768|nr:hypothetical protein llg_34250 [Luteolibacter sp. LG18]
MLNIPNNTLEKILELRAKNGLDATPEALEASLEAAKCKWTLEDTPRYRRAGDAPIYISGKYLTQAGICPATGEKDAGSGIKRPAAKSESSTSAPSATPSQETFYRVLHGKGFDVKITKDLLTGEIREEVPREISELNLQFSALPARAEGLHVIQTTPQIQVAMSLDKFLELARIKP